MFFLLTTSALAATVTCSSSPVTTPSGGGNFTLNVDCLISGVGVSIGLPILPLLSNTVFPTSTTLTNGAKSLNVVLQPGVSSPDGSAITVLGSAGSGFSAVVAGIPAKLRFQYTGVTTSTTSAGTYSFASAGYSWNLNLVASGTAGFSLQANVPVATGSTCTSPTVNATGGGGPFTASVVCTVSGNPAQLSPALQNIFSPTSLTLINGTANLNASLQPAVTSPDGSVTGIVGTAGGGFTGTVTSFPASIQVQYTGNTTSVTPSGTYTSPAVTYNRSAI